MEPFSEISTDFQSDRDFHYSLFHYSRPSNKIYVAYFIYPVFVFCSSILPQYQIPVL